MENDYNKFTIEKLKEVLDELSEAKTKQRSIIARTGKYGAINYACILQETLHEYCGEKIIDELRKEIRIKVESADWPDGIYKIQNGILTYEGIYE